MRNQKFVNKINHIRAHIDHCNTCNEILDLMLMIYEAKDQDYCNDNIPMQNLRICEEIGIPAWKGTTVRICDKKQRIQNLLKRETYKVQDEKIEDTLIDMANYSLLASILIEEHNNIDRNFSNQYVELATLCVRLICCRRQQTNMDMKIWEQITQLWESITEFARNTG